MTTTLAATGRPETDAVIEAIEEREQIALHERHLAAVKAERARTDALHAAQRGDLGAVQSALARLARYAHTAGAREQDAGHCTARLAAALDPSDDPHATAQALSEAVEALTVAHQAARLDGALHGEIERVLAALRLQPGGWVPGAHHDESGRS